MAKAGELSFWVCINLGILEVGADCGFEFNGAEDIATCRIGGGYEDNVE